MLSFLPVSFLCVSGQFFGATIFLLSLSSAMTVLIMKLHFSGEHGSKVPRWLRKLVLICLARVVRMNKTASKACKVRHYDVSWKTAYTNS